MSDQIDWKQVEKRLRCPICGEKAHISSGTDGTEGEHTHYFPLSRAEALRLSQPTVEEALARIPQLEAELSQLRKVIAEGEAVKALVQMTSTPAPEEKPKMKNDSEKLAEEITDRIIKGYETDSGIVLGIRWSQRPMLRTLMTAAAKGGLEMPAPKVPGTSCAFCHGVILADTEDWPYPACNDCYEKVVALTRYLVPEGRKDDSPTIHACGDPTCIVPHPALHKKRPAPPLSTEQDSTKK